jgi:hypothetical protein
VTFIFVPIKQKQGAPAEILSSLHGAVKKVLTVTVSDLLVFVLLLLFEELLQYEGTPVDLLDDFDNVTVDTLQKRS